MSSRGKRTRELPLWHLVTRGSLSSVPHCGCRRSWKSLVLIASRMFRVAEEMDQDMGGEAGANEMLSHG